MKTKVPHKHYDCNDVGLSGERPFRVCTTHWDRHAPNVLPGDDPNAHPESSRALILYATEVDRKGTFVPLHTHEFYEIFFVRQASQNLHTTLQGTPPLRRGDVFVITPGACHGFEPLFGLYKTDIFLQPTWLSHELRLFWREEGLIRLLLAHSLFEWKHEDGLWRVHLTEEEMRRCEQELDVLTEEARSAQPSLALFSGCFLKLLAMINKAYLREEGPTLTLDPTIWDVVVQLDQLLENGDPLDIDQLAENSRLSRRNLDRLFRKETGLSITQHYRNRRLQHAARLLTEPTSSIKEIAHSLNFADTAHFVRSFKQTMGITPGDYRHKHVHIPGQTGP